MCFSHIRHIGQVISTACSFEHGFYFWNYTILFAKTGQVPALLFIRETWRASIRPRQKKKWAFFLHGH